MSGAVIVLIYKVCAMVVGVCFALMGYRLNILTLNNATDLFEKSLRHSATSDVSAHDRERSADEQTTALAESAQSVRPVAPPERPITLEIMWRQNRLSLVNLSQATLFALFGAAVIICADFLSFGIEGLKSAPPDPPATAASDTSGGSSSRW